MECWWVQSAWASTGPNYKLVKGKVYEYEFYFSSPERSENEAGLKKALVMRAIRECVKRSKNVNSCEILEGTLESICYPMQYHPTSGKRQQYCHGEIAARFDRNLNDPNDKIKEGTVYSGEFYWTNATRKEIDESLMKLASARGMEACVKDVKDPTQCSVIPETFDSTCQSDVYDNEGKIRNYCYGSIFVQAKKANPVTVSR